MYGNITTSSHSGFLIENWYILLLKSLKEPPKKLSNFFGERKWKINNSKFNGFTAINTFIYFWERKMLPFPKERQMNRKKKECWNSNRMHRSKRRSKFSKRAHTFILLIYNSLFSERIKKDFRDTCKYSCVWFVENPCRGTYQIKLKFNARVYWFGMT